MYKLLSDEVRKRVESEYSTRRLVVILGALVLILLVWVIGLLPSYLLSRSRQEEVSERVRIIGNLEPDAKSLEVQKWLSNMNLRIRVLSPRSSQEQFSNVVQGILSQKGGAIRLNNFSWKRDSDGVLVSLSGVAETRQSLIEFENKLKSSGEFEEVVLPVSNLAKDREINFLVKLTPKTK